MRGRFVRFAGALALGLLAASGWVAPAQKAGRGADPVPHGQDRNDASAANLEEHDIAGVTEGNDKLAKERAMPAASGFPTGERESLQHGQRLRNRIQGLPCCDEILLQGGCTFTARAAPPDRCRTPPSRHR